MIYEKKWWVVIEISTSKDNKIVTNIKEFQEGDIKINYVLVSMDGYSYSSGVPQEDITTLPPKQ